MEHVALVAIVVTTILVAYRPRQDTATPLKICTRRWNLRGSYRQISYSDLIWRSSIRIVDPIMTTRATCPIQMLLNTIWWRHKMDTFSALLAICAGNSPVPGEFPTQRPVTWSFHVFFDLCLNKRLSKQSWGWWFETPSRPLWRHRNEYNGSIVIHPLEIWIAVNHC